LSQEGIFNPGRVFSTHHYESIFSTLNGQTWSNEINDLPSQYGLQLECIDDVEVYY
jgi:hypothetical protein